VPEVLHKASSARAISHDTDNGKIRLTADIPALSLFGAANTITFALNSLGAVV